MKYWYWSRTKKKQTWVLVSLPPRNNTPVFRQLGGGFFSIIFQVSLHTNWLLSCINTFKGIELYTRSTMRHTQLFLRANHRFHRLYTTQFYKKSTSVGWRGSWFRCKGRWWPKDWYCQYVTLFSEIAWFGITLFLIMYFISIHCKSQERHDMWFHVHIKNQYVI